MAARRPPDSSAKPGEHYTHGYEVADKQQEGRDIENSAFFLRPHLKKGMSVIDCGSGTGRIAISLAGTVAPGRVEGVDFNPGQVETSTAAANAAGVSNVRFQQGTIYGLPFADGTFDVALAHTVLQHLSDPVKALREIRRVLKPGGVVGVREEDWDSWIWHPNDPVVKEAMSTYRAVWERNGGRPAGAKMHREWMRLAGFARTEAGASAESWSSQKIAELPVAAVSDPQYVEAAIRHGLADNAKLQEHAQAFRRIAKHPDVFTAVIMCHAIGWKE